MFLQCKSTLLVCLQQGVTIRAIFTFLHTGDLKCPATHLGDLNTQRQLAFRIKLGVNVSTYDNLQHEGIISAIIRVVSIESALINTE